jgi:hypothetical protein
MKTNRNEVITGKRIIKYFTPFYGLILYFYHRIKYNITITSPWDTLICVLGGCMFTAIPTHLFKLLVK